MGGFEIQASRNTPIWSRSINFRGPYKESYFDRCFMPQRSVIIVSMYLTTKLGANLTMQIGCREKDDQDSLEGGTKLI